ncbi:MAG TPA: alpha/beta hydrolase [Thermoanaerobaculia bacterium]|nr:alpha/beta hydrolase [Thermoanaerobaculia bacterium]
MRSIAIVFVVTLAVLFLFAQFVRRTSMFFPERHPLGEWETSGFAIRPQDNFFTTSDGVVLHAWLFRAAETDAPLMIWFHGNGGNLTHRAGMAEEFARRGVSTLLFDWRGYGRSGGSPSEAKLYLDSEAAAAYAVERLRVAPRNLVLYGESLGGPYAAHVARTTGARCVVLENSFPSLRALGNTVYRPLPLGWFAPFAMATVRWLNQAKVPVLVIHGRRDRVIPFSLAVQLYEQLATPKAMFVSETAGHCEVPVVEGERYYTAVTEMIRDAARAR